MLLRTLTSTFSLMSFLTLQTRLSDACYLQCFCVSPFNSMVESQFRLIRLLSLLAVSLFAQRNLAVVREGLPRYSRVFSPFDVRDLLRGVNPSQRHLVEFAEVS